MTGQILVDRATIKQALEAMLNFPDDISDEMFESIRALRAALAESERDWSMLEATQESLREHMAEIHRLRAALAQQPEPAQEPVHDERTTIADLRCSKWLDPECADKGACQSLKFKAQRDALKQTLHDELAGNLRLRDLGGARPDEPMLTFLERIIADRDALLDALKSTGLFLHHCWCDVQMNDYSFERLNRQMEIVDAAIKAVEEGK